MRLVRCKSSFTLRRSSRTIVHLIAVMLLSAGLLMVAQAEERLTEFTRRAYLGIGAGGTILEPKTPHSSLAVSSNSDSGFHIVGGFDFTSRLSAEVYYADLGAANIAFLGDDIGDINYQVFGLSAIGYIYNSRSGFRARSQRSGMGTREGLSLFGRVGVGSLNTDSEVNYKVNNNTHLALGVGAEYGFRNGLALRGEYRALDSDQQYASLSLVKRFGKVATVLPVAPVALPQVAAAKAEIASVLPEKPDFSDLPTVNFEFDKSEITQLAASKLDEVVSTLGASDVNIMLEGHADWLASERYNYDLSMRRAESVRRYLESKGMNRAKISVTGYGETRPIAMNDTAEGRAKNRRVDIRIN